MQNYCQELGGATYAQDLAEEELTDEEMKAVWICPECGEERKNDARVAAGMKCGYCAYYKGD